jgi:peptide/nickel transport system permease protein
MKTATASQKLPVGHRPRKINWPLSLGIIFVGVMLFLAVFGPSLAPQDPMKENYILKVDGKIRTPPYPPLKIDGYPLGTDRYGRDLFSRILWGVRPTMLMVVTVALVRLFLGVMLGLAAGWSKGRAARFLDSLISFALSIPALIAALVGIFIVGINHGLIAFIVGLGLTGWAESGRMVAEQTRSIKSQTFVEAARALGASDRRILYKHVLRHIQSPLWMLLSFEVSSALLISAELGFLGYYIGGGIWVEVSDFTVVNAEGLPELGQMISSALVKLTDPSGLVVVGSVISMGVLGFNLLGEGLRLRMSREWMQGGRRFRMLSAQAEIWLEEQVFQPVSFWVEEHRLAIGLSVTLLVLVLGAGIAYNAISVRTLSVESESLFVIPGDQLWATERHDPFGTFWVEHSLETEPQLLWSVDVPGGPVGGPAVAADGTIYVAGKEKILMAIDPNGVLIWQSPLEETPVGGPALDAEGRIFVADVGGGVTALDPQGIVLWRGRASNGREASAGPIVDSRGNIYTTIVDAVAAISPQGDLLWFTPAATTYVQEPPRLSPDQKTVFLRNSAIQVETGKRENIAIRPPETLLFSDPAFFSGANGLTYYRVGHEIIGWRFDPSGLVVDEPITWVHDNSVLLIPADQGVTRNGLAWFFYTTSWTDSSMVWIDGQARLLGNYNFPRINARLIAIGGNDEAYICSSNTETVECFNISVGVDAPTWTIKFESKGNVLGGALIPGRILLSVSGDRLYVFGTKGQ